jgi:hypothetical protein
LLPLVRVAVAVMDVVDEEELTRPGLLCIVIRRIVLDSNKRELMEKKRDFISDITREMKSFNLYVVVKILFYFYF